MPTCDWARWGDESDDEAVIAPLFDNADFPSLGSAHSGKPADWEEVPTPSDDTDAGVSTAGFSTPPSLPEHGAYEAGGLAGAEFDRDALWCQEAAPVMYVPVMVIHATDESWQCMEPMEKVGDNHSAERADGFQGTDSCRAQFVPDVAEMLAELYNPPSGMMYAPSDVSVFHEQQCIYQQGDSYGQELANDAWQYGSDVTASPVGICYDEFGFAWVQTEDGFWRYATDEEVAMCEGGRRSNYWSRAPKRQRAKAQGSLSPSKPASASASDGARKMGHGEVPKATNFQDRFPVSTSKTDEVTTLMLRNIPNPYNQRMLILELVSAGLDGKFDFVYLPIDRLTRWNVGYAFVNFDSAEAAAEATQKLSGRRFCRFGKRLGRPLVVSPAHLQGIERNREYYRTTAVQFDRLQGHRPLVVGQTHPEMAESSGTAAC